MGLVGKVGAQATPDREAGSESHGDSPEFGRIAAATQFDAGELANMLYPETEFRDLRRRRDRWRLRLWLVMALAACVVFVVLATCSAVYLVRESLIDGHPPPSLPSLAPR